MNLLKEYDTLDSIKSNQNISINQNYYTYILLFILAIGTIFLLFKLSGSGSTVSPQPTVQYGGDLGSSAYVVVFIMALIVVLLKYFSQ